MLCVGVSLQRSTQPRQEQVTGPSPFPLQGASPQHRADTRGPRRTPTWWVARDSQGTITTMVPSSPGHCPGKEMLGLSRGNELHLIQSVTRLWYDRMTQPSYRRVGLSQDCYSFLLAQKPPPARKFLDAQTTEPSPLLLCRQETLSEDAVGSNRFCQIAGKAGEILDKSAASENQFPNAM